MAKSRSIWDAIRARDEQALRASVKDLHTANKRHSDGDYPLHKCCEAGFNLGVDLLLANGADPLAPGKENCTPLAVCAIVDNIEAFRKILTALEQPVQTRFSQELLSLAATHNSVEVAKYLLKGGLDPNLKDPCSEYRTALHWAAQQGSVEIVDLLLAAGADPNLPDVDGFSPLHIAAAENEYAVLRSLIKAGGDLSMKCAGDRLSTPLHVACEWRQLDAVRELIAANANKFELNALGMSPFDLATESGDSDLIALFR